MTTSVPYSFSFFWCINILFGGIYRLKHAVTLFCKNCRIIHSRVSLAGAPALRSPHLSFTFLDSAEDANEILKKIMKKYWKLFEKIDFEIWNFWKSKIFVENFEKSKNRKSKNLHWKFSKIENRNFDPKNSIFQNFENFRNRFSIKKFWSFSSNFFLTSLKFDALSEYRH